MAIHDEWYDPGPDGPQGVWGVNVRTFGVDVSVFRQPV
jgi:hypothetical protein